MSIADFSVI